MKKILFLSTLVLMFSLARGQSAVQTALGALDTLTNADTTTYTVTVSGAKSTLAFQTNVTKISGTVAGTIKVYGSLDGTNYITTAVTIVTVTDASVNYGITYTSSPYVKYKVQIITSGTQSCSQRTWMVWRKL